MAALAAGFVATSAAALVAKSKLSNYGVSTSVGRIDRHLKLTYPRSHPACTASPISLVIWADRRSIQSADGCSGSICEIQISKADLNILLPIASRILLLLVWTREQTHSDQQVGINAAPRSTHLKVIAKTSSLAAQGKDLFAMFELHICESLPDFGILACAPEPLLQFLQADVLVPQTGSLERQVSTAVTRGSEP
jgi:hypothetical protein